MRLASLVLGLGLSLGASAAAASSATLDFDVLRDGKPIGSHHVKIEEAGASTTVEIVTDVAVKFAFISLYRFEHEGQEVWRDGQLQRLSTVTNDDGDKHRLEATASPGGYHVTADGTERETPALPLGSLWHGDLRGATEILNTLDGRVMKVSVQDLGDEKIEGQAGKITAHRYAIRGELQRDVWFDEEDSLVRLAFRGKDGSEIVYRRRSK